MFKLQCDKHLVKILERFFRILNVDAEISTFSADKSNICIICSNTDLSPDFVPESDYIIINSDDKEIMQRICGRKSKIVTCGLSTRSTVTLSSISESGCVMCLQRSVSDLIGNKLSPFEFPFESCGKIFDEVSVVMILTAALLCGANVSQLNKIYL